MFDRIIKEQEAKELALQFVSLENIKPTVFATHLGEINDFYWKNHGFKISKMKSIENQKKLIEELELDSIVNLRYNIKLDCYKIILKETEKLEEKDLKY